MSLSSSVRRSSARRVHAPLFLALLAVLALRATACLVEERCYEDRDCESGSCDEPSGECMEGECQVDEDCGGFPFECVDNACEVVCSDEPLSCPDDMVAVCGSYCIDIWEASRLDATEKSVGVDNSVATSREGVMPWYSSDSEDGMNREIAAAACEAADKRLCTPQEWELVCATTVGLTYSYGDAYEPSTCNGIDTFCDCDGDGEPDGEDVYPHCRQECDTNFHTVPTGTFSDCTNEFGVFDINGNVWEVVGSDDGINHYRGGAYNCSDSERLHKCAYDGAENGGFPSAKGFRCCADGEPGR